jgi:Uma2 family endonuclease
MTSQLQPLPAQPPQPQSQDKSQDKSQDIFYPDNDGQPMSDNTLQFAWIVKLKEGCEALFQDNPDVFVAGDLLWYPTEGDNKTCRAPDTMVVLGRPKGYRGSYKQWLEDDIAPQVVFEILSPNNTLSEMALKLQFYNQYGVEEYYLYDPEQNDLTGWQRTESGLTVIEVMDGWESPRLGIKFVFAEPELEVLRPDGQRFLSYVELMQQRDRYAEKLRELGIDPAQL